MHGGTADEGHGYSGHCPGQAAQDDDPRQEGTLSAGQGEPTIPGAGTQHALGVGFHLCRNLEGVRLCGFRHRRLCPQDRRLACQHLGACGVRPLCLGTGGPRTPASQGHGTGSSQRPRLPIPVHPLHRAPRRSRHRTFGWQRGRQLRQRAGETINGLFKAEVIHRRGPWRSFEAVEYATLEWVDWFNNRRLLEPIGNIPPAEAEVNFYAALETDAMAA